MANVFTEFDLTGTTLSIAVFLEGGFYVQQNDSATTFIFFGPQQITVDGDYATVRDQLANAT